MKADLHLHTYYSDGTESPAEIVARAAALGFDVVAVTDHDTVGGVCEALEAGKKLGVQIVPGVEITVQFRRRELHLLAYFSAGNTEGMGWCHPDLARRLEHHAWHRQKRAERMVERLNALGVSLTMKEVYRQTSRTFPRIPTQKFHGVGGTLGRPHIAAALFAAGHVTSLDQAFRKYLKKGCPAWVAKEYVEAREVIALIHQVGGIVALAHPGLLGDENIPAYLCEEGIDGVEVYHSRHSCAQSARFRDWTWRNGLLITGGSDCHGMLREEPLMGCVQLQGEELDIFLKRLNR